MFMNWNVILALDVVRVELDEGNIEDRLDGDDEGRYVVVVIVALVL